MTARTNKLEPARFSLERTNEDRWFSRFIRVSRVFVPVATRVKDVAGPDPSDNARIQQFPDTASTQAPRLRILRVAIDPQAMDETKKSR